VAEGNDQDRTEKATPKKRDEARKKGQVARSREIPSVLVLLSALTVFYFAGSWMFGQLIEITHTIFQQLAYFELKAESLQTIFIFLFQKVIVLLAPLLLAVALASIIGNVAQVGFMITGEPLTPKLSKLNPLAGLKRLFSPQGLAELIKSLLKVAIIGTVAYVMLRCEIDKIPALVLLNTWSVLSFIGGVALKIGFYTCLVLIVLAGIDYLFQRWQHERDLRMTKQEVKDEYKQSEGDPMVRSRIRAAHREMGMRRMMESIPDATVVITKPTHLAIAIKFERNIPAPMIVAKGAGKVAERIRAIAKENDVPILEQKPLARDLFKLVEIGQYVPVELHQAVAEVLAYVYRLKGLMPTA